MLELLMSTGSDRARKWYPDSGPGNKELLAGTPALGYFGLVPSSEVVSYMVYKDNLNRNMTITMNAYDGWFKFFYKGRVIFISCRGIGHTVSWDTVYQAGGVYGTNSVGSYPSGNPRMQYKPISVSTSEKTWTLIPRLPHCNDVDGGSVASASTDTFEFNSLMGRLIGRAGIPDNNYPEWCGSWAQYDYLTLDMDKQSQGMETGNASNRDRSINRGAIGNPLNGVQPTKTYAINTTVMRGVLELANYSEPYP